MKTELAVQNKSETPETLSLVDAKENLMTLFSDVKLRIEKYSLVQVTIIHNHLSPSPT